MAKKKKIVISEEELVPTTLAIVQDKKKASIFGMVWLFIIFIIFIGGVIYLPEISTYVNNYLNPESVEPSSGGSTTIKDDEDEDIEKTKEYTISSELVILEEKISLSNFNVDNNVLTFKINNLTNEVIDLSDLHYFMEIYNESKKLLERIYLQDILSPSGSTDESIVLSETPSNITLAIIEESEYPAHVVDVPDEGVAKLVCTKDYERVEYSLSSNKAYVANIIYEVDLQDPNFNALLSNYQILQTSYNAIEGVSSTITTENNILLFKTIVNLSTLKENTLNLKTIYPYGTDAKVIYFELSSSGYTCN